MRQRQEHTGIVTILNAHSCYLAGTTMSPEPPALQTLLRKAALAGKYLWFENPYSEDHILYDISRHKVMSELGEQDGLHKGKLLRPCRM